MDGNISKRGDSWRARYRGTDRKERSKSFKTKREAAAWLAEQTGRLRRGEWVDPARGKILLGVHAEDWFNRKVWTKHKTKSGVRSLLDSQVLPEWESWPLDKIDYEAGTAWVARLSGVLSSSRTRSAFYVLRQILDDAVRTGRLVRNPLQYVDVPVLTTERIAEPLTVDEVEALASKLGGKWGTLVRLLAFTGLRWAEGIALRPMDLDLVRLRVDVARTISEVRGVFHTTDTKGHRRRSVPIPAALVPELTALMEGLNRRALLFPWKDGGTNPPRSGSSRGTAGGMPSARSACRMPSRMTCATRVHPC